MLATTRPAPLVLVVDAAVDEPVEVPEPDVEEPDDAAPVALPLDVLDEVDELAVALALARKSLKVLLTVGLMAKTIPAAQWDSGFV